MSGPVNLGQSCNAEIPGAAGQPVRFPPAASVYGQVFPDGLERPENKGYSWLKAGAEFTSLTRVPTISGGTAGRESLPARRGFEDLVMMVNECGADTFA